MKGNRKELARKVITDVVLLVSGIILGLVALFLVYCIPTEPIQLHVEQSLPMLEEEFEDSELITNNPATLTGSFTDCLMLENAIYDSPEHSLLEQILYMYRGESYEGDGWAPGVSLVDYIEGTEQPGEVEYSRYWHGYLVVLRPLFFLTTFQSVRLLASILQFLLVGYVFFLCINRGENLLGFAFVVSVPFFYFVTMSFSLSLSICFYIMTIAMVIQLKWNEQLQNRKCYGEFFLIVGMATSYFDFLTYPLVCLGFPLCVALYLNRDSWKQSLCKLLTYSVLWCGGYVGMWAGKWILTDLLVGGNTIKNALQTVLDRTDTASGQSVFQGFVAVLLQNAEVYCNWGFYLLLCGIGVVLLGKLWKNRQNLKNKQCVMQGIVIGLVALFPIAWFLLTQNHSEQHYMFTCKILALTVFAGVCAISRVISTS